MRNLKKTISLLFGRKKHRIDWPPGRIHGKVIGVTKDSDGIRFKVIKSGDFFGKKIESYIFTIPKELGFFSEIK